MVFLKFFNLEKKYIKDFLLSMKTKFNKKEQIMVSLKAKPLNKNWIHWLIYHIGRGYCII
jgi:hypothetical protein